MISKTSPVEIALGALQEVCEAGSVGKLVAEKELTKTDLEISFECLTPAYKDWNWTVVLSRPDKKSEYTISEIVLLASEHALLAPAWVPWAERLAEYRKQLREEGRANSDAEADAIIQGLAIAEVETKTPKVRVRQRRIRVVDQTDLSSSNQEVSEEPQNDSADTSVEEQTKIRTRKPRAQKKKEQSEKPTKRSKK